MTGTPRLVSAAAAGASRPVVATMIARRNPAARRPASASAAKPDSSASTKRALRRRANAAAATAFTFSAAALLATTRVAASGDVSATASASAPAAAVRQTLAQGPRGLPGAGSMSTTSEVDHGTAPVSVTPDSTSRYRPGGTGVPVVSRPSQVMLAAPAAPCAAVMLRTGSGAQGLNTVSVMSIRSDVVAATVVPAPGAQATAAGLTVGDQMAGDWARRATWRMRPSWVRRYFPGHAVAPMSPWPMSEYGIRATCPASYLLVPYLPVDTRSTGAIGSRWKSPSFQPATAPTAFTTADRVVLLGRSWWKSPSTATAKLFSLKPAVWAPMTALSTPPARPS